MIMLTERFFITNDIWGFLGVFSPLRAEQVKQHFHHFQVANFLGLKALREVSKVTNDVIRPKM